LVGSDSLKYYSFSSVNNAAFDSTLFTLPFIVSKLNGMIEGFDFSYFPSEIKPVTFFLNGPVKTSHIYDYELGDEYHYQHQASFSLNYSTTNLYILKVINKVVHNPDSVSYTFERKIREDKLVGMGQGVVHQYRNYMDTINPSYNLNKTLLLGTYMDIRSLVSSATNRGSIGAYDSDYDVPSFVDITQIGTNGDSICDYTFEIEDYTTYIFGIGRFNHYSSGDPSSWHVSDEELLYYKKGTKTWGTPLVIITGVKENSLTHIRYFPNPVKDQFTIENLREKTEYNLMNVNGAMIDKGTFNVGSNSISISNLDSGIYFLQLQSNSSSRTIKLIKE
jgi:hypothetical protein